MSTKVVIISCKVMNCGFGCDDNCGIVISSSSDPKIPIGSNCAKVMADLIDDGYDLVNTSTLNECSQIVYTLVKFENKKPTKPCITETKPSSKSSCSPCSD